MTTQHTSGEIDMHYLFRKFKNFFKKIVRLIFVIISFFIKYWIITLLLILIGIGWGYFVDSSITKTYKSEGIVIPNYGSVDYLYSAIDDFNHRIATSDTLFLKSVMGEGYGSVREVKIEPIADIYNTMSKSREQFDVFRVIYQNQDFDKFIDNLANSKYFKYHKIEFMVQGEGMSEKVIPKILEHWNSNDHFLGYQSIYKKNAEFQVKEYDKMFGQIDSIISSISTGFSKNQNPGVIISENNNLSSLFERKEAMLTDFLDANVRLNDYTAPVKLVFMNHDIVQRGISNKIKYPIYLVALFAFIFFLRYLFLKMKAISEN